MKLKAGDKVRFLNDSIEGEITEILTRERVKVTDMHGFTHIAEEKFLVRIDYDMSRENEADDPKDFSPEKITRKIAEKRISVLNTLQQDENIYAAIRLQKEDAPLNSDVDFILANNSSYDITFSVSKQNDDHRSGIDAGILHSRMEHFIGSFSQDELYEFDGFEFQFLFFMKGEFKARQPITKSFQFNSSDFVGEDFDRKLRPHESFFIYSLAALKHESEADVSRLLEKFGTKEEEQVKAHSKQKLPRSNKVVLLTKHKVVDLHIEELVKDYQQMNNAQIIAFQINFFLYEMDQAVINKLHKITFIHGVGQGVLKHSIREELKRFDSIKFDDAPNEKFGYGATEVEFL